jgi:predicted nucleic acid-binding protein
LIVIDASTVIDFLTKAGELPGLVAVLAKEDELAAPALLGFEFGAVLRKQWMSGQISNEAVTQVSCDFWAMPIDFHALDPLYDRAWELRHNVTFYDAAYVALAEQLNVPLLTRDKRLAASSGHTAKIHLI